MEYVVCCTDSSLDEVVGIYSFSLWEETVVFCEEIEEKDFEEVYVLSLLLLLRRFNGGLCSLKVDECLGISFVGFYYVPVMFYISLN